MKSKLRAGIIGLVVLAFVVVFAAVAVADAYKSWRTENGVVIQRAGNAYLQKGHDLLIKSKDTGPGVSLDELMNQLPDSVEPFVLDVRGNSTTLDENGNPIPLYNIRHIRGAHFITSFEHMAEAKNLDLLDEKLAEHIADGKSGTVVVYCNSGHTAGFLAGVLGSLGYDVKNLRDGYNNGWSAPSGFPDLNDPIRYTVGPNP